MFTGKFAFRLMALTFAIRDVLFPVGIGRVPQRALTCGGGRGCETNGIKGFKSYKCWYCWGKGEKSLKKDSWNQIYKKASKPRK